MNKRSFNFEFIDPKILLLGTNKYMLIYHIIHIFQLFLQLDIKLIFFFRYYFQWSSLGRYIKKIPKTICRHTYLY